MCNNLTHSYFWLSFKDYFSDNISKMYLLFKLTLPQNKNFQQLEKSIDAPPVRSQHKNNWALFWIFARINNFQKDIILTKRILSAVVIIIIREIIFPIKNI